MASVKQFLIEVMLFAVALLGGRVGRGCYHLVGHSSGSSKMKNV